MLLCGDAAAVLSCLPSESIDTVITSPPYFHKREYLAGGIGLEQTPEEYLERLYAVCVQIHRVLKPTGSFWLNLGDSYHHKSLLLLPQRLAIRLTDRLGFVLRNQIVWHKVKGAPDSAGDRLRNVWEPLFFFTKSRTGYYCNIDAVRNRARQAAVVKHGAVVSATGVTGVRYRRKIELSTALSAAEKEQALQALNAVLHEVETGQIPDFRMVLRGSSRATHGTAARLSGRAAELQHQGFYILRYSAEGAIPGDVWDILPEDSQHRSLHYAPFPEDLVRTPLLLSCPPGGVVLDPFAGTGTVCRVACSLGLKSVGIDLSEEYLQLAAVRCGGASGA